MSDFNLGNNLFLRIYINFKNTIKIPFNNGNKRREKSLHYNYRR